MRKPYGKHGLRGAVIVTLVLALLLVCFAASANATTRDRPFQGYMPGTVTYSPGAPGPPPNLYAVSAAVGDVSHMGRSVMSAEHIAAFDFSGDMTLTGANGDMIYCEYEGGGAPPPNIGDWYDIWNDATIVGGTGRFEGATGFMHQTITLQYLPGVSNVWPAIWSWTGTINY